jgi:polysaccharide biosynthesis/export protein
MMVLRQVKLFKLYLQSFTRKNKMARIWILFVAMLVISSCVPNRKIVYLQKDDVNKGSSIPKDSVLRSHPMQIQEYRIQPLDILSIQFESLTSEEFDFFSKSAPAVRTGGSNISSNAALVGILVDVNGEVEYPVVGKISVAGLTIFEAQSKLQRIAAQYLKDVVVRVRMLNFRYTLLGEVNGENTVVTNNPRLTMMEAIGQAGGLTELADRSNVKVIRQVGNESQVFYVNLLKEDYIESPFYYVQQNDVIIVPPLRQRAFKRYFSSNLTLVVSSVSAILFFLTISDRL